MSDNFVLKLAHLRIHEYADDFGDLMSRHEDAMECRDCEEFLQRGIESARFLFIAENIFRDADYRGISPYDDELRNAVESLYLAWFNPSEFADKWIDRLKTRGYVPDNLDTFRQTCESMRDAVERKEWQSHATAARLLTSADEPW
jgi:hypothetical protein